MNKVVYEFNTGANMSAFWIYNGPTIFTIEETKNKIWVGNEKNNSYIILTKNKIEEIYVNPARTVAVVWNKKDAEIHVIFCDRTGRMRKVPCGVFGDILKVDFFGNHIYLEFKKTILKVII